MHNQEFVPWKKYSIIDPGNFFRHSGISPGKILPVILGVVLQMLFTNTSTAYTEKPESVITRDGYELSIKRYANEGGVPVILAHGFFQNYCVWDLPEEGHSLAVYLAQNGFDVWMPNFRAHGYGDYESESPPDYNWCFDDFAIYDTGAIIRKVTDETGSKPFWIGHSMGGLAVLGWLQGVEYEYVKVDDHWVWRGFLRGWEQEDIYDWRVESNPDSVSARQERIAGFAAVSSPGRMKWKVEITWWNWFLFLFDFDDYWSYNLVAESLANSIIVNLLLDATDYIPSEEIISFLTMDIRDIPIIGPPLADFFEWVSGEIGTSMMFAQFWWKENMNDELVLDELEMTVDAVSGMTVRQFMHSISQHNLMEYHYNDRKRSAYRYDKHYDLITVPALVVTGEFDKIANAYVVHNDLFEKLGSSDKIYTEFAETGHGDMIVGLKAENDLFPLISDWLMERSGEASLVPKD